MTQIRLVRHKAFSEIVTRNTEMLSIFHYIESVAPTLQPVLITGETGVGKELISRAIHTLSRLKGRFVAVNVAGLDDNMFSDSLFGHVRGAFTGAERPRPGLIQKASDGTLFLDEIGDLSPPSQVKLLRLLEEGEYLPLGQDDLKQTNARIVASTNEDLWAFQRSGKFRKDLNFRMRPHYLHIPPLRDRLDDIPLLLDHFIREAARIMKRKSPKKPKELSILLRTYSFPGNIRELKSMVFDAVSRSNNKVLSLDSFKHHMAEEQIPPIKSAEKGRQETALITFSVTLPTIKQATQLLVSEALKRANGKQTIAAKMLGISHQALSKRLKKRASETGSRKTG